MTEPANPRTGHALRAPEAARRLGIITKEVMRLHVRP